MGSVISREAARAALQSEQLLALRLHVGLDLDLPFQALDRVVLG